jgi:radical SAM protein with 4Fe4S-binding SPASM domain
MKVVSYKKFSFETHQKNWRKNKPNFCQFELTFGCDLNCRYCYSSCYNNKKYIQEELTTKQVKYILDKLYEAGVIWLCFTGGDPLTRRDFLDIYSYAKNKGFIITVFTNAYSVTKEIAGYLKKKPPFAIEITLNAVKETAYENISQVKGSFTKVMKAISLILKAGLSLNIKTQVTKENLGEVSIVKKFVSGLGLKFRPSAILHARLDGDLTPCNLRITPQEAFSLSGKKISTIDDCKSLPITRLFPCAISGGDGIHLDPWGNIVPCACIREPKINLLREENIEEAKRKIQSWVKTRHFVSNSKCKTCVRRSLCHSCPGKALLEMSDMEAPISYFCELAHGIAGKPK